MIYLGNKPVGLLSILPEWTPYNNTKLEFNQYQSFDVATLFFSDSYVNSFISILPSGNTYKMIFENNTNNARAGQWITFTKNNGTLDNVTVMRVGLATPQGSSYGVDVYENAECVIYINTMGR